MEDHVLNWFFTSRDLGGQTRDILIATQFQLTSLVDWDTSIMIDTFINVAFCLSSVITVLMLLLPSQYDPRPSTESTRSKTSVQILVLGDIGRSPRMQYHALSIARNGGQVVIIGYAGARGKNNQKKHNAARSFANPCRVRSSPRPDLPPKRHHCSHSPPSSDPTNKQ